VGETLSLTVVADDGTEKSYSFTVTLSTGSKSSEIRSGNIKMYPNPTKRGATLHADLDRSYDNVTVSIYDSKGGMVQQFHKEGQFLRIPVTLSAGIYIVAMNGTGMKRDIAKRIVVLD
jgi:hypothetical protein